MEQAHVRHMRTWYGMNGTVVIGPGFRHSTGLGGLLLPHPPVVNQLLRHRLPSQSCPPLPALRVGARRPGPRGEPVPPRLGGGIADRRSCGKKNDRNDRDSCPIPGMTQSFDENIEKLVAVPVPLADPDSHPDLFPPELRHDIPPFASRRPWASLP